MSDVVGEDDGLRAGDLAELSRDAEAAHETLQQWRKSEDALFYDLVFEQKGLDELVQKAEGVRERFENIVVLGIGGSALGLRCIAGALLPPYWNVRTPEARAGRPRLFVCDNVDPESFSGLLEILDLSRTCFTIISKSGTTTEPAALSLIVLNRLKKAFPENWQKHLMIITDPERGELRSLVKAEGIDALSIPQKLGGRFSVLSPVGLFPAACLGLDVQAMLAGAQQMAERCSGKRLEENPAYQIGGYHHRLATQRGKAISVMFSYSDALLLAADWYAQLWAESLGKEGFGQTPVRALGATDQHSQVQLYMQGPKDKAFTFLAVDTYRSSPEQTRIEEAEGAFRYLQGKELGTILSAEQRATAQALAQMQRPSITIRFPSIDAQHLGEFFMLYEIATSFAGALYGINPFDQPGVELGKKLTREILSGK